MGVWKIKCWVNILIVDQSVKSHTRSQQCLLFVSPSYVVAQRLNECSNDWGAAAFIELHQLCGEENNCAPSVSCLRNPLFVRRWGRDRGRTRYIFATDSDKGGTSKNFRLRGLLGLGGHFHFLRVSNRRQHNKPQYYIPTIPELCKLVCVPVVWVSFHPLSADANGCPASG